MMVSKSAMSEESVERANGPLVSVVMPVFNGEAYLRPAVASVLQQSLRDLELIVVDDGSSDGTLEILREMAGTDSRMRIISRPNTGIVGALNDGLAVARGMYVGRLDSDDIALPGRLEKQVLFLEQNPDVAIVGSMWLEISADGGLRSLRGEEYTHEEIEGALLRGKGAAMMHPTVMMRRQAVEKIGGYREQYKHVEDYDLFLRLAEIGRLANLAEPLIYRRMHDGSACVKHHVVQQELKRRVLHETASRRACEIECESLSWSNEPRSMFQRAFNQSLSALRSRWWRKAFQDAVLSAVLRPWHWFGWLPLKNVLRIAAQRPRASREGRLA